MDKILRDNYNSYCEFSKIYDELINEDINYELYGNKILEIYKRFSNQSNNYLDLACGTGNLTKVIGKEFKSVFSVDISSEMLMLLEEKFKRENLKSKIINQNMIHLNLNKQFNLITCFLDGTNYILKKSELNIFFQNVYKHLCLNGIFIFDINSAYKIRNILGNNVYTYDCENIFYVWENSYQDTIVNMDITYFVKNKHGFYEKFIEFQREKAYEEEEIEELLNNNNLSLICKLDNYESEFIGEKTERIAYVVTRR